MNIVAKITAGAGAALLLTAAQAGVTLNSARIGGPDVAALGKFYEAAFGLKQVNKLTMGPNIELFYNVGDTVEAAKANKQAQIVIMHADATSTKDPVPHLILNVTDMAATVAAVKAAGGAVDAEPRPFGTSGMVIGFATDPAGNRIELIQPAKQ
ncbi:MAG TPA: VOC family protein [Gammaproteobacteria bacterium]|nr:VOC family protein [Gammaproteobacteria bacterium]